jgi:hypothetical protein
MMKSWIHRSARGVVSLVRCFGRAVRLDLPPVVGWRLVVISPPVVALLLLVALLMVVAGAASCGGGGSAGGTSAPSGETPALSASTSARSADMPAVGSMVTIASMAEATVPPGDLVEVLQLDSNGDTVVRMVVDPAAHKGFSEMSDPESSELPPVPSPNLSLSVFDDGGHSEMSAIDLEIYSYGGSGFADFVDQCESLLGRSLEVRGYETVAGLQTYVVTATRTMGDTGVPVDFKAYIDPATGLVMLEELTGVVPGGPAFSARVERRVIAATPELLQRMEVSALPPIAEGSRAQRVAALKGAPSPVYGLPTGYPGLTLTAVISAADWRLVRLQYGPVAAVTTLDLSKYPDYGAQYLAPLDQAWLDSDGSLAELRFSLDGVGVQVQGPAESVQQLARDLVVVGGPGSR